LSQHIHLNRQHNSEEVLHRTKTEFYIILQTNIFIILINICKLVRSQALTMHIANELMFLKFL